jgi:hypothetical protein
VALLHAGDHRLNIASPRRIDAWSAGNDYNEQVDWETHHLRQAAREGVILFWLAREAEHRCDRAYAQTTRFELAEWQTRHQRDGTRLVVGIEEGFSGAKYIRRRLGQDAPRIPIYDSLAQTCQAVVQLLAGERPARLE